MNYIASKEELIELYMAGYFNGKTDCARPNKTVDGLIESKNPIEKLGSNKFNKDEAVWFTIPKKYMKKRIEIYIHEVEE